MRMARAFIASVPLGVVLVAALVVPLTVIPGTFAFQGWPMSLGGKVSEDRVQVAPVPVSVATRERKARPDAPSARPSHQRPARHAVTAQPAPAAVRSAPSPTQILHGHRTPAMVDAPAGAGPGDAPGEEPPAQSAPGQTPAPQQQQPAPDPPTIPVPGSVASDAPPIARED